MAVVYDAQSRVRQVSYANGQSEAFDYDRVGNRVYQLARSGVSNGMDSSSPERIGVDAPEW